MEETLHYQLNVYFDPGGSLVKGTPKVRPLHGIPAQACPKYNPAQHTAQRGSIIKGQRVYRPQDAAPRRQHLTHAQDSQASSHSSMEVYKQARGSFVLFHTHYLVLPAMSSQGYKGVHAVSLKETTSLPSQCRRTHETHQAPESRVRSTRIEET